MNIRFRRTCSSHSAPVGRRRRPLLPLAFVIRRSRTRGHVRDSSSSGSSLSGQPWEPAPSEPEVGPGEAAQPTEPGAEQTCGCNVWRRSHQRFRESIGSCAYVRGSRLRRSHARGCRDRRAARGRVRIARCALWTVAALTALSGLVAVVRMTEPVPESGGPVVTCAPSAKSIYMIRSEGNGSRRSRIQS